jgi:putative DNA primase/helicase
VPGDWTDADTSRTVAWINSEVGFAPRSEYVEQAIQVISRRNAYHPVREYLESLVWDRTPRLDQWLHVHMGAKDDDYSRAIGSRWLISAVARVMAPGCKVDCLLVLEGAQGAGKSTALAVLAGADWFADSPLDIGNKDSLQNLRRKWIYEIAELASLKGAKVEKTKAFITTQSDYYRPSFGRRAADHPRQVVFAGTTNLGHYLADDTGARRFWPVACGKVDIAALRVARDQLWGEALARYKHGERWHVDTAEVQASCEVEQEARAIDDPIPAILAQWLEDPKIEKREQVAIRLVPSEGLSIGDILMGAFGKEKRDLKPRDGMAQAVGHHMSSFGWERRRRLLTVDKLRSWAYFPPAVPSANKVGQEVGQDSEPF